MMTRAEVIAEFRRLNDQFESTRAEFEAIKRNFRVGSPASESKFRVLLRKARPIAARMDTLDAELKERDARS